MGSIDPPDSAGGYTHASYASGGGGASRVPRIAGDVTAGPALASCMLVSGAPCTERRRLICSGAASRRDCPMGVQLGFMGVQLGSKAIWAGLRGLRLRCGDW
jgi:hypothetical protein